MEQNDIELLLAYQRDRDEPAFAQLVERHGPWIFSAARRRLGDDALAEDATQAVFVVLAEKASELVTATRGSLSPWLFHVVLFTCARLRRSRARQTARERSPELAHARRDDEPAGVHLLLLMEDSIAQLPAIDRDMVVRRFYRRQPFAEIGGAFGVGADAARKRVNRALSAVRQRMLRDGIDAIPDVFLTNIDQRAACLNPAKIHSHVKETMTMTSTTEPTRPPPAGGHQMISAEFLVKDVEANLDFFEKLGFPRRFVDKPDADGRVPRASLTAGALGKIWIRRAEEPEVRPTRSVNIFFWIDGGPDGLIAHRRHLADAGVPVTAIVDEHGLPNFNVSTPDGYSVAFFTQYVPPGQPAVPLVL